jgi:hypothetical protein
MARSWFIAVVVVSSGCSVHLGAVRRNDVSSSPQGIPFYRPMPYLMVKAPILLAVTDEQVRTTTPTPPPPAPVRKPAAGAKEPVGSKPPTSPTDDEPADDPGSAPEQKPKTDVDAAKDGLEIVYLPDFCESYALSIDVKNAKLEGLELSFTDGWMLTSIKGSLDNSIGVTAITDIIKAVAENATKVALGALGKSSDEKEPAADDKEQSLTTQTSTKRTVNETYLAPGLYPLFVRETADGGVEKCDSIPRFSQSWKEKTFTRKRSTEAKPRQPGLDASK